MNKNEYIKSVVKEYQKNFGQGDDMGYFGFALETSIGDVESFLTQKLEEAYTAGQEEVIETILKMEGMEEKKHYYIKLLHMGMLIKDNSK